MPPDYIHSCFGGRVDICYASAVFFIYVTIYFVRSQGLKTAHGAALFEGNLKADKSELTAFEATCYCSCVFTTMHALARSSRRRCFTRGSRLLGTSTPSNADGPVMNRYSRTVTQPKTQGASQVHPNTLVQTSSDAEHV
jgi:hypothetical protein